MSGLTSFMRRLERLKACNFRYLAMRLIVSMWFSMIVVGVISSFVNRSCSS
jgi:hypothetical protein